jgi:hypothetical protein
MKFLTAVHSVDYLRLLRAAHAQWEELPEVIAVKFD